MFQTSLPMIHVWFPRAVKNGPLAAVAAVTREAVKVAMRLFFILLERERLSTCEFGNKKCGLNC